MLNQQFQKFLIYDISWKLQFYNQVKMWRLILLRNSKQVIGQNNIIMLTLFDFPLFTIDARIAPIIISRHRPGLSLA